jgi:hypothetical protein
MLQARAMMIKTLACAALLMASSACATMPPAKSDGIDVAFAQTAYVDGPKIRPIKLIEDSRCPMNARCIWAGRVRILVAWVKPGGDQNVELTLGEPVPIADGSLTLTDVKPSKMAGEGKELSPSDYRFSFQFSGGL